MYPMTALIPAFGDWIIQQQDDRWNVFYINIMFKTLGGSAANILSQMKRHIESRFYPTLCEALERHPGRSGRHRCLPRLILFPDLPCVKRDKMSLREATVNSGFHLNGFVAVLPQTRLKVPFTEHIADQQWCYTGKAVRRVHVELVTREPHKVTDYAMKTMKRGRVDMDHVLLLPRPWHPSPKPIDPATKALKDIQSATNISDELARAVLRERGVLKARSLAAV